MVLETSSRRFSLVSAKKSPNEHVGWRRRTFERSTYVRIDSCFRGWLAGCFDLEHSDSFTTTTQLAAALSLNSLEVRVVAKRSHLPRFHAQHYYISTWWEQKRHLISPQWKGFNLFVVLTWINLKREREKKSSRPYVAHPLLRSYWNRWKGREFFTGGSGFSGGQNPWRVLRKKKGWFHAAAQGCIFAPTYEA